ncbi:polysaccharide biosynthesis/export family protein [Novosphingobium decolorationis]|uniref:Polysaccharide export protein n=1 Tax=Novosphingobium decolorationis TaxID=2698673 RepID=A0ABX8E547_9SPHN|nr:polysaccharide biosynthesis/export family protein [Novosphingobium decolorationis]QVM83719.1 polysaccharide export protein [Novosphingobium decolorationis]
MNSEGLASGPAAYELIPAAGVPAPTQYLIQPEDVLDLRVFGEEEISNPKLRVDTAGAIQVPFAGQIQAAGRDAVEVGSEIAHKLSQRYLVNPQVTLAIAEAAPRYVSVEGEVKDPGVYEMSNNFTLLSAIARAGSTSTIAKLEEVVVLRDLNGQKMAARFDLRDIRGGAAPDPIIMNNDIVVVGRSGKREALENVLKAAPAFNGLFYLLKR